MLGLLVNRWVVGALTGLIMLGFAYWKGYVNGQNNIQQKFDAYVVAQEREAQIKAEEARQTERDLQARINKIQKEKRDVSKIADTKYHALVDSLRQRPQERDTSDGVSGSAGNVVGCTGEGLARPDAEFLAGFAADAARLQAAYDSCRKAYEVVFNPQNKATD